MSEKNPYKKTEWIDHIIDKRYPEGDPRRIVQEGTRAYAEFLNNMEQGIYNCYEWILEDSRRLERVEVKIALQERSSSNNVFYDPFDGQPASKIELDTANSVIKTPLIVGDSVLSVNSTTGFKTFTEVSVYDDVNIESVLITAIDETAKTITVQALTNSYKKGAKIARSNVIINPLEQKMNIGTWGTYSVTAVEVI